MNSIFKILSALVFTSLSSSLVLAQQASSTDNDNQKGYSQQRFLRNEERLFNRMDMNRDGKLTKSEIDGEIESVLKKMRIRLEQKYYGSDTSHMASVTKAEFDERMKKMFQTIDVNGNGRIDRGEMRSYNEKLNSESR